MEPPRWSRFQWGATVLTVAAAQVFLVWWFSTPLPGSPNRARRETRFYLGSPMTRTPSASPWRLVDPALFALPNECGFSGPAWLSLVPVEHQSTNWTPAPRLLTPVVTLLGEPFRVYARTSQVPALKVALSPSPEPTDVHVTPERTLTHSELHIEGDLAARPLLTPVALPSVANSELLENSVVRVVVDAKGWVRSQALLATSGAKPADDLALELTRSLRFQPLKDRGSQLTRSPTALTRGELVIQWHTLPVTNAVTEGR